MTRFAHRSMFVAVLSLAFTSCAIVDSGGDSVAVSFRTSSVQYRPAILESNPPQIRLDIEAEYENLSSRTIYLRGCLAPNYPVLEKRVDEQWEIKYALAEPACLGPPYPLRPGESFTQVVEVHTPVTLDLEWELDGGSIYGTYRLRRTAFDHPTDGGELALENRVSNTFSILE